MVQVAALTEGRRNGHSKKKKKKDEVVETGQIESRFQQSRGKMANGRWLTGATTNLSECSIVWLQMKSDR